jgi:hypothetical protein
MFVYAFVKPKNVRLSVLNLTFFKDIFKKHYILC